MKSLSLFPLWIWFSVAKAGDQILNTIPIYGAISLTITNNNIFLLSTNSLNSTISHTRVDDLNFTTYYDLPETYSMAAYEDSVYTGSGNFVFRLNPGTELVINTTQTISSLITAIAVNGNNFIYTGHEDGSIIRWNIDSKEAVNVGSHEHAVTVLLTYSDFLFSAGNSSYLKQWSLLDGAEVKSIDTLSLVVELIAADDFIFVIEKNGTDIRRWRISTGEELSRLNCNGGYLLKMHVHGDYLFTIAEDKFIKIWQISIGAFLRQIDVDEHMRHIYVNQYFSEDSSLSARLLAVSGPYLFFTSDPFFALQQMIIPEIAISESFTSFSSSGMENTPSSFDSTQMNAVESLPDLAKTDNSISNGSLSSDTSQPPLTDTVAIINAAPTATSPGELVLATSLIPPIAGETYNRNNEGSDIMPYNPEYSPLPSNYPSGLSDYPVTPFNGDYYPKDGYLEAYIIPLAAGSVSLLIIALAAIVALRISRIRLREMAAKGQKSLEAGAQVLKSNDDLTAEGQQKPFGASPDNTSNQPSVFTIFSPSSHTPDRVFFGDHPSSSDVSRQSFGASSTLYSSIHGGLYVPGQLMVGSAASICMPIKVIHSNKNSTVVCAKALDSEMKQRSKTGVIAVKTFNRFNAQYLDAFCQELSIMYFFVGKPNFVQLIGFCSAPFQIFTDYYSLGSLEQAFIALKVIPYTKKNIISFALQISSALSLMHQNGFAHGDIKSLNVFVDYNDKKEVQCYLGDFGLSQVLDESHSVVKSMRILNMKGLTVAYASAELLEFLRNHSAQVAGIKWAANNFKRSDVYALAILLSEIANCKSAWDWRDN